MNFVDATVATVIIVNINATSYPNKHMKIGIVILNYKNWKDTVLCAESVLASIESPAWVIIVDNASPDDSVPQLQRWAKGDMDAQLQDWGAKTISIKPLHLLAIRDDSPDPPLGSVCLVCNKDNRGYAAGNNTGIRPLMGWGADAVWILNNDTVVDNNALGAMQQRLFSKTRPGLCGSRVHYMDNCLVQCRGGGKTNPWTGLSVLDGYLLPTAQALQDSAESIEKSINFIYGASVMASRTFIEQVGLMDERYFLYCEEQDWAYSAKGAFDLAYAPDAIVYHKEGGTTGSSSRSTNYNALWHLTRSRVLLAAKHHPCALPAVGLSICFAAFRMAWRRLIRKA